MILTLQEHLTELGERIRARRVALNLTQQAASMCQTQLEQSLPRFR